jgi:hypothetical protein
MQLMCRRYQHGPAAALGPPYVYSYYYKNYEQLEEAVALAHSTPIERLCVFIPIHSYLPVLRAAWPLGQSSNTSYFGLDEC